MELKKVENLLNKKKWLKKDIIEVRAILMEAKDSFYNSGESLFSDEVYDILEERYEKLTGESLPVGAKVSNLVDTAHGFENFLGTLGKVKAGEEEQFKPMLEHIKTAAGNNVVKVALSQKIDGNSLAITFDRDGNVLRVITRGDDGLGKDLTKAFKNSGIFDIPNLKNVDLGFEFESATFKFEAAAPWSTFNTVEGYKNPRNYVSGQLSRSLDQLVEVLKSKVIHFYMLGDGITEGGRKIMFSLVKREFNNEVYSSVIRKYLTVGDNFEGFLKLFSKYSNLIDSARKNYSASKHGSYAYDVMTDGVVVECTNEGVQNILGWTSGRPNYALAYKFKPMSAITTCTGFRFDFGKSTGRITPVITFDTVIINGNEYSNVSLANYKRWNELQPLGVGSKLLFTLQNDTLGYIDKLDVDENKRVKPFEFITECPTCKTELDVNENGTFVYCRNKSCTAKVTGNIYNFLDKIGVKNIGLRTIESIDSKYGLETILDIYRLTKKDLMTVERMAEESSKNFIREINKVRAIEDWKFIGALSIEGIGRTKCKDFFKHISLEEVINFVICEDYKGLHDLSLARKVPGFKDKSLETLYSGISDKLEVIVSLMRYIFDVEVTTLSEEELKAESIKEIYTFCITGSLKGKYSRKELTDQIRNLGHKVTGKVTGNTSRLINNDLTSTSSKNKDAMKLNVPIITEDELYKLLNL